MPTDSAPNQNSITEADFIAAKELAYGCLSAMEELHLACGDISTLITEPAIFALDNITLLPPDQGFSRITRAVEFLCKVLDSSGVQVAPPNLAVKLTGMTPKRRARSAKSSSGFSRPVLAKHGRAAIRRMRRLFVWPTNNGLW
jgi:hypothetical protein